MVQKLYGDYDIFPIQQKSVDILCFFTLVIARNYNRICVLYLIKIERDSTITPHNITGFN